jgi:hypothetical protein
MDYQKMTRELAAVLTHEEIARIIGCQRATVTRYADGSRGKRPGVDIAMGLLRLHRRMFPEKHGLKPKRQVEAIQIPPNKQGIEVAA